MKIIIEFIQLILFPVIVYSIDIWTEFDMALSYRTSRILNNVILSFLYDSKSSLLIDKLNLTYGIFLPVDKTEYIPSENSCPELEQSYISLIKKIMRIPILDHGTQFELELERVSMKLLSKTCSNDGLQCQRNEDGLNGDVSANTQLKEMEQAQIVNLLVSELCNITELANSYWDSELDEFTNSFLSNLGYKGRHISKIHKNCLYNSSDGLNKRQRMDFHKYFDHEIKKSQIFILELNQKIKEFSNSPKKYRLNTTDFNTAFLKHFPHEYYSFLEWLTLYEYLEKFKNDLIQEINLNTNFDKGDVESAIKFISGEIISGDFVKIIKNRRIDDKIYKVLHVRKETLPNLFNKMASKQVFLQDSETGKRLQIESNLLIRTMDIACVYRNIQLKFFKELAITKYSYLIKKAYMKSNVNCKFGDILLSTIISMLNGDSKLKNITLEHVISAIEILNYSLRFNEFPGGFDNDLKMPNNINVQGLTTPNLMKCGSPLLILIINRYNSLTGKFPDYQNCSLKSVGGDIGKCEPVSTKINSFEVWKKAFEVSFSNNILDLSFDDKSISFWNSSIKSSRTDDASIVQGYAECDIKCLNSLLLNKGTKNNIVFDILGQMSWHLSSDMMLLDKLIAKFYSMISIQTSSIKSYGETNVSAEVSNRLKYRTCDNGCYTYEPDSVLLGCFRWLENKSNHVQKIPLMNYYYLALSIHSRFTEILNTYKNFNPGKLSKKFTRSVIHKYYKFHSIYIHTKFMPPQNYPLASYVLQIVFFLNDYLENYKSNGINGFPKNFNELAKAAEPSSLSSVNKLRNFINVLRKYAIEFIFRFISNNNKIKKDGVVGYIKYKMVKLGGISKLFRSVINDGNNANLEYGSLAVATVLSWALNGQEIVPKHDSKQWKPYVSNLFSSNIPQYRKYFFYMILNNAKSPDQVAWDMISEKCKINNPKAVKRNLLNVLTAKNNILLVVDMAKEIVENCNNTNYDIETSRLFTESNCHYLKLDAIKHIKFNDMKIGNFIKSILNNGIKNRIGKTNVVECDWFYDIEYYKLVQKKVSSDKEDYVNLNLIKTIKLSFGYKEFEYEYVPRDVFITGVYDYYSLLFDNLGNCNKTNEIVDAKCQYEILIKDSKKQILLQQVYDGKVYVLKRPIQTKYKFGRVFLTEDTLNRLLISSIEIPECNGKCNVDDFRKVILDNLLMDGLEAPIIKPRSIDESYIHSLNVLDFNSTIFELYHVKDIVSGETITIDDVKQQRDVLVCADDDFYHNNIDIESIKYGENVGGLMKYPAFGYKFLKKYNAKHMRNGYGYFLVNLLPDLSESCNNSGIIVDPVETKTKKIAQVAINVN